MLSRDYVTLVCMAGHPTAEHYSHFFLFGEKLHLQTAMQITIVLSIQKMMKEIHNKLFNRERQLTRENCVAILSSRSSSKSRTYPAASAFSADRNRSVIPCIDMHRKGSILNAQSTTAWKSSYNCLHREIQVNLESRKFSELRK